jgi:hypothetical protein
VQGGIAVARSLCSGTDEVSRVTSLQDYHARLGNG